MKRIFVSGMFRSGTTLISRLLNANKNITCISDPYAPLFKFIRNKSASQIKKKIDFYSPLSDYYFNQNNLKIFKQIQKFDPKSNINSNELSNLKKDLIKQSKKYCPELVKYLKKLTTKNINNILNNLYNYIEILDNKKIKYIGFKEVWTNEFVPTIIKNNKNTRILLVIRDPRSIVASNYNSNERYPIIFLCRQWRKLTSLALYYKKKYKYVKIIKYENLILNPKVEIKKICKFLNVEFDPSMLDINNFYDTKGKKWNQNSSYNVNKNKNIFNTEMLNKWKLTLPNEIIEYIQFICFYEMKKFGYRFLKKNYKKSLIHYQDILKLEDTKKYASWIKKYSKYNYFNELNNEFIRNNIIKNKLKINKKEREYFFIKNEFYNLIMN